jgi:hypothetical protein
MDVKNALEVIIKFMLNNRVSGELLLSGSIHQEKTAGSARVSLM